jgi:SAM-dependent methyltransferase
VGGSREAQRRGVTVILRPWWFKCAAQRVLSSVPGGHHVNSLWSLRARLRTPNDSTVQHGLRFVRILRILGFDFQDRVALELGTGWQPIIPYLFRLAGCRRVILCDTTRHITPALLRATLRHIRSRDTLLAAELQRSVADIHRILPQDHDGTLSALLEASGFEYQAPCDAAHTNYPQGSLDLITSHAVLEHVPRESIRDYLLETRRLLRPGGMMVHLIDHRDHWHHFDPGIGPLNFLKFSRRWWGVLNSPLAFQNRMRSLEYLDMIQTAGFEIRHLARVIDGRGFSDAHHMKLDRSFQAFSPQELAVTSTFVVAQPCRAG